MSLFLEGHVEEVKTIQHVTIGSRVTVEIHLGQLHLDKTGGCKHMEYVRFRISENYTEIYKIGEKIPEEDEISCGSFIGGALLGAKVGDERTVNVGGVGIDDLRVVFQSGNHMMFKIVSVE